MAFEETVRTMASIFAGLFGTLFLLSTFLTRVPEFSKSATWLAPAAVLPSKRAGEIFSLAYSAIWIGAVVVVIYFQSYERWDAWGYMVFGGSVAAPFVLVPAGMPAMADKGTPWFNRYTTKANLWIAIFSFIGNYWYTHYFYRVLKADYTFDAHRLNDVPICLYFMTHAYFMFYHVLSNMAVRFLRSGYVPGMARTVYEVALIVVLSYSTAFMEAITICAFPYYRFADVHMAYTIGSFYYGLYFLVSFPMFLRVDEDPKKTFTLFQTAVEALASSMLVLCLLDFVRLYLGVPLFTEH